MKEIYVKALVKSILAVGIGALGGVLVYKYLEWAFVQESPLWLIPLGLLVLGIVFVVNVDELQRKKDKEENRGGGHK